MRKFIFKDHKISFIIMLNSVWNNNAIKISELAKFNECYAIIENFYK